MIRLSLALVVSTLSDIGTAHPAIEVNPVVLALGPSAIAARFAATAVLLFAATLLATRHRGSAAVLVCAGVLVGMVGTASNVAALR